MTQPRDNLGRWRSTGLPSDIPTEVTEPVRAPSVEADVLVPALQALLVGCALGIATAVAVALMPDVPLLAVPAAMGGGFALSFWPLLEHARSTVWRTTTPVFSEPDRPQTVRVELTELGHAGGVRRMQILDLPVDDDRLRQFAKAAVEGHSLAVHRWTPGAFTRHEYEVLSDELQRAGLLVVTRNGRRLTTAGRHVLRHLAE